MKMMYHSSEASYTYNDYTECVAKPYIEGNEMIGSLSLTDINSYAQYEIDNMVTGSRAVMQVTAIPAITRANTLYMVGPKADGSYDRILYDELNNPTNIGAVSPIDFMMGDGVTVTVRKNLNIKEGTGVTTNNEYIVQDIATEIASNNTKQIASPKAVYDYVFDGTHRGVVPDQPQSDRTQALSSNGYWNNVTALYVSSTEPTGSFQIGDLWLKPWE